MSYTATYIRTVEGFSGHAALYELEPDHYGIKHVIASAIGSSFDIGLPETMIFPSNEDGEIEDWLELAVIYNTSHEDALDALGYELAPVELTTSTMLELEK